MIVTPLLGTITISFSPRHFKESMIFPGFPQVGFVNFFSLPGGFEVKALESLRFGM